MTGDLRALADACGVATAYLDYLDRPVEVSDTAVRLALEAMGVAADSDEAVSSSLIELRRQEAERLVPPSVVVRQGRPSRVPVSIGASAGVTFEDGRAQELPVLDGGVDLAGIEVGYHTLHVSAGTSHAAVPLIVVPDRCRIPQRRGWGWMVQLYQARSAEAWGMGDLADLAELARWSGGKDAAMLLVNPLHAASPGLPQQPSPYFPSSRRFRSPLYLRIEQVVEIAAADGPARSRIVALAEQARRASGDLIDRDAVYSAKDEALRLLYRIPLPASRRAPFDRYVLEQGAGLEDFAVFCALALRHGVPWQQWPAALHDPRGAAVARARAELADDVGYFMWLQWLCDEQLAAAQAAATSAGMEVGVIHDLAVGVDPGGADAWALQSDLASAVTIGAPPDGFNQRGQDWQLPPLLPARLAATGYTPFRDMLRSVLRHAGGIRIDHIMGLWRLWWVPEGRSPAEGTYVRYPASALLGVLALEAQRAGAVVVGEDLGTVEKGVRDELADRGILSSRVLWFERVDDEPEGERLPAAGYPAGALTSITTHDLPTAAGWWADSDIEVRTRLRLLGDSTTPEEERRQRAQDRAAIAALLAAEQLIDSDDVAEPVTDPQQAKDLVVAMHRFIARTPSVLVASGLGDALGDRRQPNMPGTTDEYPNWRLPLARTAPDNSAEPLPLEDVLSDPGVHSVADVLRNRG